MSSPFMFEKPLGMKDTLPLLYDRNEEVTSQIAEEVRLWGYQTLHTPALEYYDTVGAASAIHDAKLFKLMDRQGRTLVLRPDMTAPIARVVSSSLKDEPLPLRLAYNTALYRTQEHEGKPAEFEQYGVELIGDQTVSADGEIMALLISAFEKTGLRHFRLAFGHIGFMNALFTEVVGSGDHVHALKQFLFEKNYVGFKRYVRKLPISALDKNRLEQLLSLRGGPDMLETAKELVSSPDALRALQEVQEVWNVLESYGVSSYMNIDLNVVLHIDYYTGVVFESYGKELGFPLASGGRYDELVPKFGRQASATGFGIRMDRLLEALNHIDCPLNQERTLILFSKERQKEAVEEAKQLRESGKRVVIQHVAGIEDLDAYTSTFTNVIQRIGGSAS
ncbi:ATP phosphoribosyltransferase regulatory subunit [Geomicrobium sediminis]|uniref:ATP phosphoribosyltransferase regulatory subunit n=1 Tax=Geomicrobium sediminis TaxID=1347788 RepID=A0ABS2P7Z6_9BACL|nr:ATP phosphoribosyltransferase regulatory subunit [Geomicrobium sediminis]MBM7631246.1 ATP phosphoribosyltransferase regulatory subunit [Geomicrobium sediminis]